MKTADRPRPIDLMRLVRILRNKDALKRLNEWMNAEEAAQKQSVVPPITELPVVVSKPEKISLERDAAAALLLFGLDGEKFIEALVKSAPRDAKNKVTADTRWKEWISKALVSFAENRQELATIAGQEKITLKDIVHLDNCSQPGYGHAYKGMISTRLHNCINGYSRNHATDTDLTDIDILALTPEKMHDFNRTKWAGQSTLAEMLVLKVLAEQTDRFKTLTASDQPLGLNLPGQTTEAPAATP